MKLYYSPGTCSLAPHIALLEAGKTFTIERVDIKAKQFAGGDFNVVNPKGSVPALVLDDGQVLTEGAMLLQYIADLVPDRGLAPAAGTMERYRLQEWLTFIGTELHKMFSPWLFHPEYGEQAAEAARTKIAQRLAFLDAHLADHPYLLGSSFTAADAYAFTIVAWARPMRIDLAPFAHLQRYMDRIAARPKVREAMQLEHARTVGRAAVSVS